MPDLTVSEDILHRLSTVAENDYEGATTDETLDRLLREHQEYVMLEAASAAERNATKKSHPDR